MEAEHVAENVCVITVSSLSSCVQCRYGIVIEDATGAGSNREIFISQATIDSNFVGLSVFDNSYVDITGTSFRSLFCMKPHICNLYCIGIHLKPSNETLT
jgi:hypothetical protein